MTDMRNNPFAAVARNNEVRERLVKDFARTMLERASELAENGDKATNLKPGFFAIEQNREWLLETIDDLQEVDPWSAEDIAKLSTCFFFLLTAGGDEDGPGDDD